MHKLIPLGAVSALVLLLAGAGSASAAPTSPQASPSSFPTPPAPGDFSWRPATCTADAELTLTVHDAYPGPLAITGTLLTPHGQPVVYPLKPGDNDILAPATAISLTLVVQVKGGEGAITSLTLQHSQWASLCPSSFPTPPSPSDFSWQPATCTAAAELTLIVHDAYPGPLAITGTLQTPHGQPVVYTLKPGDNHILAPATATSLTLVVQVKGGEGAITNLTLQHSQWASLCPPAAATTPGLPGTGRPPSSR